jgi:hypothetical protein
MAIGEQCVSDHLNHEPEMSFVSKLRGTGWRDSGNPKQELDNFTPF